MKGTPWYIGWYVQIIYFQVVSVVNTLNGYAMAQGSTSLISHIFSHIFCQNSPIVYIWPPNFLFCTICDNYLF